MPAYPAPRTSTVEWERVPQGVREVITDTTNRLRGGKVTRSVVVLVHGIYRVTLYVTPQGEERPTHGVQVVVNYDGANPRITGHVRVGDKWL